jgi:hypothetical protein
VAEDKGPTGSAIGARREQIAGLDRAKRLSGDHVDVREQVEQVRETPDLYKVYLPEWIYVFTSTKVGDEGRAECEEYFAQKFEGRVYDHDVKYAPTSEACPSSWPWRLQLQLPNVKGEFKTQALAEEYVSRLCWEGAQVVARNSRAEYALRDYGQKKLPAKRS